MEPEPTGYQEDGAWQKRQQLWSQVIADRYDGALPDDWPSRDDLVQALGNTCFNSRSMLHASDYFPVGRRRLLHTFGSVARVSLVPSGSAGAYPGLLRTAR